MLAPVLRRGEKSQKPTVGEFEISRQLLGVQALLDLRNHAFKIGIAGTELSC